MLLVLGILILRYWEPIKIFCFILFYELKKTCSVERIPLTVWSTIAMWCKKRSRAHLAWGTSQMEWTDPVQSRGEWSSRLMHQKNSHQRSAKFFSELQFWRDYYDGSGNSVATEKTDKYAVCISTHVFEMLKVLGA